MVSTYSQEYGFGSGALWGIRTDLTGTTPVNFGTLQDVSLAFNGEIKPLHGEFQYAVALARGKSKVELTSKFAQVRGALWNNLYFGSPSTATQILTAENEADTASASSYTVTNSTKFLTDLGVTYQATGLPLTFTASASPATLGYYHPSTNGTYKLASGDASAAVYTSYTYSSTSGVQITITNQRMGTTPTFKCIFEEQFDGRQATFILNNVVADKLTLPTKIDDWQILEMTMQVSADASGNIGTINVSV